MPGLRLGLGMGRGGKPPWTLASIPDMAAWWRLDQGVTTVSGAVSAIASQGGLGHPLVQSIAGSRPTFESSGWVDGGPSMLLDGSSDFLTSEACAACLSGADKSLTLIMLFQWVSTTVDRYMFHLGNSATSTPYYGQTLAASTLAHRVYRRDDTGTGVNVAGTSAANTSRHVLSHMFTGTSLTMLRNGASIGIDGVACDVGTVTFDMFTIGAARYLATVGNYANIRVAEIAAWTRALSSDEEGMVRADMIARRGL